MRRAGDRSHDATDLPPASCLPTPIDDPCSLRRFSAPLLMDPGIDRSAGDNRFVQIPELGRAAAISEE